MYYLPFSSKKKSCQAVKTEPSHTIKKNLFSKQINNLKSPIHLRINTPPHSDILKIVPKTIIYDKQTLYIQVQELKTALNRVMNDNLKLRTKIAFIQAEKDRLNRSSEHQQIQERYGFQSPLTRQQSIRKLENLKYTSAKKQLQQLKLQNEALKKQNNKIKRTVKYSHINELQLQIKVCVQENMRILTKYEQLKKKTQHWQLAQNETENQQKTFNVVSKQNKKYSTQIQQMHLEIMNIQGELRKQRDQFINKQKKLIQQISEAKKKAFVNVRDMIDFKKQNSALKESHIRSIRGEQRIQNTSFKTHHIHAQPIRKNKIFNVKFGRKTQFEKNRLYQSQNREQNMNSLLNYDNKRQSYISQEGQISVIAKTVVADDKHIRPKQSNVQTNFSQNIDKLDEPEIIQQTLQKIISQQPRNPSIKSLSRKAKPEQTIQNIQKDVKSARQNHSNVQIPQLQIQTMDGQSKLKKYQSEYHLPINQIKYIDNNSQQEQLRKKAKSLRSKLGQQKNKIQPKKAILKELKTLLTYRFMHQKYTFQNLRNDILSSKAAQFTYIDICHMLVSQPFYLNVDYCRIIVAFIFEKQKPKHQQSIQSQKLITKFRKFIRDYETISPQNEHKIIEKCIATITKNYRSILQALQKQKNNGQNSIQIEKLRIVLKQFQFSEEQIQYLIIQTSINSDDLHHITYELLLQRFAINSSQDKSSKHQIIFEHQDEQYSNLDKSNIGKQEQKLIKVQQTLQKQQISHKQQTNQLSQTQKAQIIMKIQQTQQAQQINETLHPKTIQQDKKIQKKQQIQKQKAITQKVQIIQKQDRPSNNQAAFKKQQTHLVQAPLQYIS